MHTEQIQPDRLYSEEELRVAWGFTGRQLAHARAEGALAYRQVGRRRLYLGKWLLAWLKTPQEAGRD